MDLAWLDGFIRRGVKASAFLLLRSLEPMDHDATAKDGLAVPAPTAPPKFVPRFVGQAVSGVTPPQLGEAMIREVRPTVIDTSPTIAVLGEKMIRLIVLAPVAWLMLAPLFFRKIMPFFCKRYTLTNQRLMIQYGLKPRPRQSIPLAEIDEVRFDHKSYNTFYLSGTLEIVSHGEVKMRLTGVREPEGFRHAIINACCAWVPGKAKTFSHFISAGAKA
jgi:Bacterial PH domain